MRQIHKQKEGIAAGRNVREPLAEGVAKKPQPFTMSDIDHIARRRLVFEKEEMKDGQIAKEIAGEIGRSVSSVRQKIMKLVRSGRLAENANREERKEFSEEEIALIIKRRGELEEEGMADYRAAESISREMGRIADCVRMKIGKLVRSGRLAENANKMKPFSDEEIVLIMRRRGELEEEGLKDRQAAKEIAGEMGRTANSVDEKIRELVRGGLLKENKNKTNKKKRERFSDEEVALVIRRRAELEKEGMKDRQAAKEIAGETGRSAGSLKEKVRSLVASGRLAENRNKEGRKKFSGEEIASIISRRAELEKAGLKDEQIAEKIAGEMGRTTSSVKKKIWSLMCSGELGNNGNKVKNRPRGFFKNMNDGQLLEYAKGEMQEKGVGSRIELQNSDWGLYNILLRRGLLDAVFAEIERKRKDAALGQLADAVDFYTGGS